jgi:hypothetical protein
MAVSERDARLQQVEAENVLLTEKVKVLTDSLFAKETQGQLSWSRNQAQPVGWRSCGADALPSSSGETDLSASENHSGFACHNAMDAPSMQVTVLSAQCKSLECELATIRAEKGELVSKLERCTRGTEPF